MGPIFVATNTITLPVSPLKIGLYIDAPKSIPSISFQVQTVSFREGITMTHVLGWHVVELNRDLFQIGIPKPTYPAGLTSGCLKDFLLGKR